jgi:hypothetical protein
MGSPKLANVACDCDRDLDASRERTVAPSAIGAIPCWRNLLPCRLNQKPKDLLVAEIAVEVRRGLK